MSNLVLLVVLSVLWCGTYCQTGKVLSKHPDITDYPYHVSVRQSGQHVCSGALVHESWIITAASCVYDSSVPKISVLMGTASLENPPKSARYLNVSKIIIHQTFDKQLLTSNIAMIKIKAPLVRSITNARPLFLPSSENYHLKEGSSLVVSGWKRLQDHRGFESQLSVTGVPLVNQRTCIRSMPSYKAVSGKMLCAGYGQPNADETCQGDIGAPLANHDVLLGILSSGDGCGAGKHPGIYTKISSFLPWISKILALHT